MSEVARSEALPVPSKSADEAVLLPEALKKLVDAVATKEDAEAVVKVLETRFPTGVATIITATRPQVATAATVATDPKGSESTPEINPRLVPYFQQWGELHRRKEGMPPWEEVARRLLNNKPKGVDRLYIDLAEGMSGGGVLIGADKEGNPLIADKGEDPMEFGRDFCDKTHEEAIKVALFTTNEEGKQVPNGYEFFEDKNCYPSDEIKVFERATEHYFVEPGEADTDPYAWRGIWLKSKDPSRPRHASFNRYEREMYVSFGDPRDKSPGLGVRRLLRVK